MRYSLQIKRQRGPSHRRAITYAGYGLAIWFAIVRPLLLPDRCARTASAHARENGLLIAIPFTQFDVSSIRKNLQSMQELGPSCSRWGAASADVWFYYNRNASSVPAAFYALQDTPEYRGLKRCIRRQRLVFANLTDKEDDYPGGINAMFFRLLTGRLQGVETHDYTSVFWMEPDVTPIKPLWLDNLVREASIDLQFWVKGSPYLGDTFDASSRQERDWIGHINGNALYRLNDPDFVRFLRIVLDREPPGHYWKPFDVSIWKVLQDFPYSWHMYQRIAHRFIYSEFVQNWSFELTPEDVLRTKQNPRTFLLHGKRGSAGSNHFKAKFVDNKDHLARVNWDGAIDPSDGVCVLIRSRALDVEYANVAIASVLKHMQGAVEIALVVPDDDVALFRREMGPDQLGKSRDNSPSKPALRVVSEERLHDHSHHNDEAAVDLQEAYTRSLADKYCERGIYVLQLRSGAVLSRKVYRKDLFFEGKPIIRYDRYTNRPKSAALWQQGTAHALGSVAAEFAFPQTSDHIYSKASFADARAHIEKVHGVVFRDFLKSRAGAISCLEGSCPENHAQNQDRELRKIAYSYSAYLGAYLRMARVDDVTWVPVDISEYHNHIFVPIIPSFTCQGNSLLAHKLGLEPRDIEALWKAVNSGDCNGCKKWKAEFEARVVRRLATAHGARMSRR